MPRGGYREKAGRKSNWLHPKTITIRVPEVIAQELLVIAHKLDAGEPLYNPANKQLSLLPSQEITSTTRLTGVQLGNRLGIASAALTPILKRGDREFATYTQERDPDNIAWAREARKYKPLL